MKSPKDMEKILFLTIIGLALGGASTLSFMFDAMVPTDVFLAVLMFIQIIAVLTLTIIVIRIYEVLVYVHGAEIDKVRKKAEKKKK